MVVTPGMGVLLTAQTRDLCTTMMRRLLRHMRGPVIALLDNSSAHQGAPREELLRQHRRLRVEHFPSYAPRLNPDEGVWSLPKRKVAKSCPIDVEELMEDVLFSIEAIRNSPEKLRGCIAQSELPFSLR
ncbi:MAG: transposase [Terracidiphilus sp.]|jgi:transposase